MDAICIKGISKSFGQCHAVSDVNISINEGKIYALIGPNGSGKTTLIKMITGLLIPDSGKVTIYDYDIQKEPEMAKTKFGYIADDPSVYEYLTGIEFLSLTGSLRGLHHHEIHDYIDELSGIFPIKDILYQPMVQYSRGNKQKVAFLSALLAKPKILIIDEPIVGLNPTSISTFGKTLSKFAKKGGSVFMATHILSFAQDYATRVGVMQNGKIVDERQIKSSTRLEELYNLDILKQPKECSSIYPSKLIPIKSEYSKKGI